MAEPSAVVDCSDLNAFKAFGDYTDLLRNRTSFNDTLLRQCQQDICQALWGFGVPDLSGIGVAIGYALSIFISAALCLSLILLPSRNHPSILTAGLTSFFESAVYFSLAVQVATITILAPKDMETQRSSIGDYEVRIAGLVSTISLLPLLAPLAFLSSSSRTLKRLEKDRHAYRLSVFCFTIVASVYPFFSQSIRYWTPTGIGEGRGDGGATYVTEAEWEKVWNVCFRDGENGSGAEAFSYKEHVALGVFHMLASLAVLLFTITVLVPVILRSVDDRNDGLRGPVRERIGRVVDQIARGCQRIRGRFLLVVVPLCLAIPLLWGFWRLRGIQGQLAVTARGFYEGNDWGFGQVLAIAIFAPVGAEMLFVWIRRRRDSAEGSKSDLDSADVLCG